MNGWVQPKEFSTWPLWMQQIIRLFAVVSMIAIAAIIVNHSKRVQ